MANCDIHINQQAFFFVAKIPVEKIEINYLRLGKFINKQPIRISKGLLCSDQLYMKNCPEATTSPGIFLPNVQKLPLVEKDLTWQNVPLIARDIFFFSNKFNWKEVEFTLNGQKKINRCDKMIDYL